MSHDAHGHGHADAGHGPPPHDAHAGPAELPPLPLERSISPAPVAYAVPAGGLGLVWPVFWVVVALAVVGVYRRESSRGPVVVEEPAGH